LRKVILSEPIDEAGMKILNGNIQVIVGRDPLAQSAGHLVHDVDTLIVRTATQVTREMIRGGSSLNWSPAQEAASPMWMWRRSIMWYCAV
jgi:phosphoglycerate dehydrogenase-like enzyme